ncbi:MAG: hypothetical protein IPM04_14540 [Saprospiraceae bacterium]|nr:hypothetical protein [Candidatus Brachybacter algidus]MBK8748997.1 hypothetical protein [Candidatus Brachybacter algidus]
MIIIVGPSSILKRPFFTPEGYDVISRNKAMDYVWGWMKKKLEDLSIEGVEEVR